nr:hypothetical protein B0A51_06082 [Rachicladosporium sp. CCFEE 5018]
MPPGRERRQSAKAAEAATSQAVEGRPWKRRKISRGDDVGVLERPTSVVRPQRSMAIDLESESDAPSPSRADTSSYRSDVVEEAPPDRAIVRAYPPAQPSSWFSGWEAPTEIQQSSEHEALENLLSYLQAQHAEDPEPEPYDYIELNEFTFYLPPEAKLRPSDMCALSRLQVYGADTLMFNGTLSIGEHQHFVREIRFSTLTIDYDEDVRHDPQRRACIQSPNGRRLNVYYRLGTPSDQYKRYYNPFVWLATFTVFFLHYLEQYDHEAVTLADFRIHFFRWLKDEHGQTPDFDRWHAQCRYTEDFRSTIAANFGYLNKECHSLDRVPVQLWSEINPADLQAIPMQTSKLRSKQKQDQEPDPSIVTPFVHAMFKRMYFAEHLKCTEPSEIILARMARQKHGMALTPLNAYTTATPQFAGDILAKSREIRPGDVVGLPRPPNKETKWRDKANVWYAYVQHVHEKHLDVIWLYQPSHTTIGSSYYPFSNELFFSDNCSCGEEAQPIDEVVCKVDVSWFVTDPNSVSDFFVRQKIRTVLEDDHHDFVSLRSSDFTCKCKLDELGTIWEDCNATYAIGDCVLFRDGNGDDDDSLMPARVLVLDRIEHQVCLEILRQAVALPARPNELMETGEMRTVHPSTLLRKCSVTTFKDGGQVVFPYDRNGAGDFFFVIDESSAALPTTAPLKSSKAPMRGLGMFCGGGNFDRGLEECGAVEFRYALDWAEHALHSYRANVVDPLSVEFFLGSVNGYLAKAMNDSPDVNIATTGEVDLISAGSPCPAFSNMQPNKLSEGSLQMASLVASVVSYVDLYSPKYLVLENVVAMTNSMRFAKDQNVFSQIIAALVALGYQAQQFLMDAWNYGSSQQRTRVFIIASAPGLSPLEAPPHTHAHAKEFRKKALGKASNNMEFGIRRNDFTCLPHVSTTSATAHLPNIGDATVGLCPAFPDHRTTTEENALSRELLAQVPIRPFEMSLQKAVHRSLITSGSAYDWVKSYDPNSIRGRPNGKSYQRVSPDGLFPSLMTKLALQDGKNGISVHWEQPRALTVQEVRIAQGFRPHEVIIGSPGQQMKIVGNSVDRWVAFALGLVLRKSWDARPKDEQERSGRGMQSVNVQPSPKQLQAISLEMDEVRAGGFRAIRRRLLTIEAASTVSGTSSGMPSTPVDADDAGTPRAMWEATSASTTPSRGTLDGATEAHGLLTPIQREGSNMESAIIND